MRRIRSKDTKPELTVRRALHAAGFRFRLHRKDLPGRPDIVLPARKACVLVNGCFWHGCDKCRSGTREVGSNRSYWTEKIERNRARDAGNLHALAQLGWVPLVVWECELKDPVRLTRLATELRSLPIRRRSGR